MNQLELGARFGSGSGWSILKGIRAVRGARFGKAFGKALGSSRALQPRTLTRVSKIHRGNDACFENSSGKGRVFQKFIGENGRVFRKFNGENGVCFEKRASTCRCVTLEVYSLRIKRVALLPK